MFCCALLCVCSGFAVTRGCCLALPHDTMGLSVFCDCGIS